MRHLFKNFLHNKKTYRLNERYYQNMLSELLEQEAKPFYQTNFGNGKMFFDGNPIFSIIYQNRVIRIIQKPPSSKPTLRVWLDKFDNLDELVISLELTDLFSPHVRDLAQKWLVERLTKEKMVILIQTPVRSHSGRATPKIISASPKTIIAKSKNYEINPAHSSEANQLKKRRKARHKHLGLLYKKEVNQQEPQNEHLSHTREKKVKEGVGVGKKSKK